MRAASVSELDDDAIAEARWQGLLEPHEPVGRRHPERGAIAVDSAI